MSGESTTGERRAESPDGGQAPFDASTEYDGARALVVVREGQITYASPAAVEMLGATSLAHLMGRDVRPLIGSRSGSGCVAGHEAPLARHEVPLDQAGDAGQPAPAVPAGAEPALVSRLDGGRLPALMAAIQIEWDGLAATQVSLWEQTESGHGVATGAPPVSRRQPIAWPHD